MAPKTPKLQSTRRQSSGMPRIGAGDESERDDCDAGDHAELQHPFVADGIAQRADKGDGEDKVSKASQSVP